MRRILLILPLNETYDVLVKKHAISNTSPNVFARNVSIYCMYPNGLLSIGSYLTANCSEVKVRILDLNVVFDHFLTADTFDFQHSTFEQFLERAFDFVKDFEPDIVGVSILFVNLYGDLKSFAAYLETRFPRSVSVCGGHTPSALYRRFFQDGIKFDAISFGEGEIPLLDLVRFLSERRTEKEIAEWFLDHPSWITAKKLESQPAFQPENRCLENLDSIPPFDLNLLVFPDDYFSAPCPCGRILAIDEVAKGKKIYLFTTRGCPHRCVFCASHVVHGRRVRSYSVERVKRDIDYYHDRYGITHFIFLDDLFLADKARATEILNYVTEKGFAVNVPNPSFYSLDREMIETLKNAGMREILISLESANEDTFKRIIHKPSTPARAAQAIAHLHEAGFLVILNILIGFPGETMAAIDLCCENLKKLKRSWVRFFTVTPLPGSELYSICEAKGFFAASSDPLLEMDYQRCVIRTPDFSPAEIDKKCYEMNLDVNFVNHFEFSEGNDAVALMFFERVIGITATDHAFAYYYAAICCRRLGKNEKYEEYKNRFNAIVSESAVWADYAKRFRLLPLE